MQLRCGRIYRIDLPLEAGTKQRLEYTSAEIGFATRRTDNRDRSRLQDGAQRRHRSLSLSFVCRSDACRRSLQRQAHFNSPSLRCGMYLESGIAKHVEHLGVFRQHAGGEVFEVLVLSIHSETFEERGRNATPMEPIVDGEGYLCARLRLGEVGADADNVHALLTLTADDQRESFLRLAVLTELIQQPFRCGGRCEEAKPSRGGRELVKKPMHGVAIGRGGRSDAGTRAVAQHETRRRSR